ncbi:MAG: hypothetical protein Kow00121_07130 [Elainellaceae cyanobacterium]
MINSQATLVSDLVSSSSGPKFNIDQEVRFTGGKGLVKHCYLDSGAWFYAIEMELDPEPSLNRIGEETKILLHEIEIFD